MGLFLFMFSVINVVFHRIKWRSCSVTFSGIFWKGTGRTLVLGFYPIWKDKMLRTVMQNHLSLNSIIYLHSFPQRPNMSNLLWRSVSVSMKRPPPTWAQLYSCSSRSLSRSDVPMAAIFWLLTRASSCSHAGCRWARLWSASRGGGGAMMTESSWDTARVWQAGDERRRWRAWSQGRLGVTRQMSEMQNSPKSTASPMADWPASHRKSFTAKTGNHQPSYRHILSEMLLPIRPTAAGFTVKSFPAGF